MENTKVKIIVADPTTLGLFGLALVTLVASSEKLGITSGYGFLLPWALFLGGIAQLIASSFDFKHNNLFGATAFGAYGLFWIGVGMSWLTKMGVFGEILKNSVDVKQLGFAFVAYFLFTIPLAISALKMNKVMAILMFQIVILFLTLALDAFGMGNIWKILAAYDELVISLTTFYALSAKYLNDYFGKQILKTGKAFLN